MNPRFAARLATGSAVTLAAMLILAVAALVFEGRSEFSFTPGTWRVYWGQEWGRYDGDGTLLGTERKYQVGPLVLRRRG